MTATDKTAARLRDAVASRNAEARRDALTQILLGIVICIVSFGFVFAVFFMALLCMGFSRIGILERMLGWSTLHYAFCFTLVFAISATISAWFRVDPLRGLRPANDRDFMLGVLMSQAVGPVLLFSPRHATAGFATVLIGGPANIFEGIGIWNARMDVDDNLLHDAAALLILCKDQHPLKKVRNVQPAVLLRKLGLIKIVTASDDDRICLTEKGRSMLGGNRAKREKTT
jgi:hypothetical protein